MTRAVINNPILPGFHPDPSIVRAGDDYYIATSTFHWWPGVRIHHSQDLVNWRHCSYAVTRREQLDLTGVPDHGGVWAPCLSYEESTSTFHLIYSNVRSRSNFHDVTNYLITAKHPEGPWSDPISLNGSGFDPSLFHDIDGRKWFVNMKWDHRPGKNPFAGILLQEYDPVQRRLVGPIKNIFKGTSRKLTEAPHLYKKDGWYYLVTAEGGTSYEHAITVARSKSIAGPYEVDPKGPLVCAEKHPENYLQKSGHGSFVETPDGRWYVAYLCGRPLKPSLRCTLGRETAIEELAWTDDGWPRLASELSVPSKVSQAPGPESVSDSKSDDNEVIRFSEGPLHPSLNTLRLPHDELGISLTQRPGYLRLLGGDSLQSLRNQSLVARRVQHFNCEITTRLEFDPDDEQQLAGLVAYYDTQTFHYCHLTRDEHAGLCVNVLSSDNGILSMPLEKPESMFNHDGCYLRLAIRGDTLRFSFSPDGKRWTHVGAALDASILSDDHAEYLGFTGMYVGLCATDLSGRNCHADFEYITYKPTSLQSSVIITTSDVPVQNQSNSRQI